MSAGKTRTGARDGGGLDARRGGEWVVTADEMRRVETAAIEQGTPSRVLMEIAGHGVAEIVRTMAPSQAIVFVGAGQNGGDGSVVARWLLAWGVPVRIVLVAGLPKSADAQATLLSARAAGVNVTDASAAPGIWAELASSLPASVVLVDAMLGTGLVGNVRPELATVLHAVNQLPGRRVSIDLPSGLDADTGRVLGVAVMPYVTVSIGLHKVGLVGDPGCAAVGVLKKVDIGLCDALVAANGVKTELLSGECVGRFLPPRDAGGHKGRHGHVLVVGGSPGKAGAAILSGLGALRSGAGLVTLCVDARVRDAVEARLPEAMVGSVELDLPKDARGEWLATMRAGKQAVVWGPGGPEEIQAALLLQFALGRLELPVVLDAQALRHLVGQEDLLRGLPQRLVLTPHPGEAAALLGLSVDEVQTDRLGAARRLAVATGQVIVLKGARTVIARPDGATALCPTGGPVLGVGGTGDLLAGVIAGLLAQGAAPWDAARLGVFVHGAAGDARARRSGERGALVRDIGREIPLVLRNLTASRIVHPQRLCAE